MTMTSRSQTSVSDTEKWKMQLRAHLIGMDIPKNRLKLEAGDISWLNRNFRIRNSEHPEAYGVARLIRLLMKEGVR
jgi:hypothetical protein